ncbi:hypothetical protein ZIOFF_015233 [Zingiber officinale]|uniref:Alpha/beta hydrolase fold-3 domain-containing protein n=1 Tax=Zingiber officinale TaxID=94328 RepID=A0A8J5HQZ0_ZINOF|nr:hypothetical protein ZIOFF_015233 [Zingiber officinale]
MAEHKQKLMNLVKEWDTPIRSGACCVAAISNPDLQAGLLPNKRRKTDKGAIFPLSSSSSDAARLCRDLPLDSARGTGIRLFLPSPSLPPTRSKLPVIVYIHSGGFIIFRISLDTLFWLRAHAMGASAEGNLPFPLTECADFSRCFLMGDSAGATITFHTSLRVAAIQDSLAPLSITGLVLDQPYFGGIERTDSKERLKNGKILSLTENNLM